MDKVKVFTVDGQIVKAKANRKGQIKIFDILIKYNFVDQCLLPNGNYIVLTREWAREFKNRIGNEGQPYTFRHCQHDEYYAAVKAEAAKHGVTID